MNFLTTIFKTKELYLVGCEPISQPDNLTNQDRRNLLWLY
jgi:hypothetical protein